MIPRAYIQAWRDTAPWVESYQVEQDLVLSRAVVEIFSDPLVAASLALRGGTVLHKLHLRPPGRYSEDIDLVQVAPADIGPVLDAIRARLDPLLDLKPRRELGHDVVTLTYRFPSEDPTPVRLRLKVEINTREHFTVYGFRHEGFAVDNPWFAGAVDVQTYALDELLGTKMRALYQRKKGRDLFDLWTALDRGLVDPARVMAAFDRYMRHEGHVITRADYAVNLARKMTDTGFTGDITPLLATDVSYDTRQAYEAVRAAFVDRLPDRVGSEERDVE